MLWFLIAIGIGLICGAMDEDTVTAIIVGLIGCIVALMVNLWVCLGWSGMDTTINAPVQGQVQTKIVNNEPSFVFSAGGHDYVIATEDVDLRAGTPRYVEKHTSDADIWWTFMPTKDAQAPKHILYVNP